ncbi:Y-family DNA polymerase, partial [Synergistaceae bacterium OttesenSCG-928-I11]|nr:Y-family DNA polymerase [Synergistaceae bacterium OttesenSCG-928-I11]
MSLLALCDCNNFFVSCERLYRPELNGVPVVVLSANDGCIISRSEEVKAMGIPMAEAYFKVEALLRKKGVVVFSGNLHLYRQVSARVMQVLSRFTDALEVYSIDEAFFNLDIRSVPDPAAHASQIRETVWRLTGIPVSIGIAPSKTLAKLASVLAKRANGVYGITRLSAPPLLERTEIGDVWGVGWRHARMLRKYGVRTAADLVRKDPVWVKSRMTVRGLITQFELMGYPCIPLVAHEAPAKSIQVSHSFGLPLRTLDDLEKPILEHTLKAGRLLREHRLAARGLNVFLLQGFISKQHQFLSTHDRFPHPVRDDTTLTRTALRLLRQIFQTGRPYTKAGVTLSDLCDAHYRQKTLFDEPSAATAKAERLAETIDNINKRLGGHAIYPAALAVSDKKWQCKSHMRSSGELEV